jgi:hypothetical protein
MERGVEGGAERRAVKERGPRDVSPLLQAREPRFAHENAHEAGQVHGGHGECRPDRSATQESERNDGQGRRESIADRHLYEKRRRFGLDSSGQCGGDSAKAQDVESGENGERLLRIAPGSPRDAGDEGVPRKTRVSNTNCEGIDRKNMPRNLRLTAPPHH